MQHATTRAKSSQPLGGPTGANFRGRAPHHQNSSVSFRFVLFAIGRWWKWVVPLGLVLAVLGATPVLVMFKPSYEASAWIEIKQTPGYILYQKDGGGDKFVNTQIQKIRSPVIAREVLSQRPVARLAELSAAKDRERELASRLTVASVKGSELYMVSYRSLTPSGASMVANAVTKEFIDMFNSSEAEQHSDTLGLLEKEQDLRRTQLEEKRKTMKELARQFSDGSETDSSGPAVLKNHPLAELQKQLISAEVEQTLLTAKIQAAQEWGQSHPARVSLRGIDEEVEADPQVQKLQQEIETKKQLRDNYRKNARGREQNPRFQRVDQEVRKAQSKLEPLKQRVRIHLEKVRKSRAETTRNENLAQMTLERDAFASLRGSLQEQYNEQRKTIKKNKGEQVDLEFQRAEISRYQQVYQTIADRILQDTIELKAPERVSLFDDAPVPKHPVEEIPWKKLALAALAGLCLPFFSAVGWEFLHQRVNAAEQIQERIRLPVIGEIACLPTSTATSRSRHKRLQDGVHCFKESIDSLRTGLVLSEPLQDAQVLVVTSAVSGEGKSSVASQLALSIWQATGERTILIDGDMRSPDLHQLFEAELSPGLAEVLDDRTTFEAAVTPRENGVDLLPAGEFKTSPHALLGNGKFRTLMENLRQSYRYIVIDTPPILPASEALLLAKAADACMLCVRRDHSRVDQVAAACERLVRAGVQPVGAALVGVPIRHYARRYGSYGYFATVS